MKNLSQSLDQLRMGLGLAALAAGLAIGCGQNAGAQVLPSFPPPDPTCVVPANEFSSWFAPGRPGLNQPVQPANSITFQPANNCNFYKWSAQMFLWLTSPATGVYGGHHVFDSQVFYQLNNSNLVKQGGMGPLDLSLRAAQAGPDGLPVVIDSKGHLREFVTAPSHSGITALSITGDDKNFADIATVRTGNGGKALFLDKKGKTVTLTPKVSVDMLPESLGRLEALAASPSDAQTLSATSVREQIAKALTAKNILIGITTKNGLAFVESGTGIVDNLEPGQAGGNGVLISQQQSVIFYETIVNDVYAWYLTGRKTPNGISPFYVQGTPATYGLFPTTGADLKAISNFSANHGGPSSFPDGNALAFEAKLSWVDAGTLPNRGQGYITTLANVPVYNTANRTNWVPAGNRLMLVALVGVHVVGSANGHPEMIWSTFEHQSNTPLATYQYTSRGQTVTVPQNTAGNWLFSGSGAAGPFNAPLAQYCSSSGSTAPCGPGTAGHIVSTRINPPAPIVAGNVLRQKPWGSASNGIPNQEDATPAAANTEVISLNTNVRSQLSAAGATTDLRYNYLFIGSTWTFGGGQPTGSYPTNPKPDGSGADEIGTSLLLNSTMETFQQGNDSTFQTGNNCFACHNEFYTNTPSQKLKADTLVSHIFSSTNPLP